ncbi:hypothetical protein JAAARDRAFT_195751 [Jaapia argillacea MUCL 33604]|uniref:Protein kinase domain-containing protein n=1 Tax=Jaapia argillacea MUCL 33604 TaxID=933084 RepID=A0A067PKJ9_9AGAM|nr:hypothetical protein JAAARDRAFT_195751 [Jaapia argillacea MUCL 33604]
MFREVQYTPGIGDIGDPTIISERPSNSGTRNSREQSYIIANEHQLRSGYHDYGWTAIARCYYGDYDGNAVVIKAWWPRPFEFKDRAEIFTNALFDQLDRWKEVHHPNIVAFLGVTWHANVQPSYLSLLPSLVLPFYENRNINNYSKSYSGQVDLIPLFLDVACGLSYLHSLSPPLPHGCVRGGNILIDSSGHACLTDIGIGKVTEAMSGALIPRETFRWFAPEIMAKQRAIDMFTTAGDVYSFGMTMYEVYTGHPPFPTVRVNTAVSDVLNGFRPPRPAAKERIPDDMWDIIESCWKQDPLERPSINCVWRWIELCIRTMEVKSISMGDGK